MAYTRVSVPKKSDNAGRPSAYKSYVIHIDEKDIATFTRTGLDVTALSLKDGKKPIAVYGTNKTIKCYDKLEGDDDAKGYIQNTEYEHPGDSDEIQDFKENNPNTKFITIVIKAEATKGQIAGYPGNPLGFEDITGQSDSSATKNTVKLKSDFRGSALGRIAINLIPPTDNVEINAILGLGTGSGGGGL